MKNEELRNIDPTILENYFLSFLTIQDEKETCCNKFLDRESMRNCQNCPHHTLRNTDIEIEDDFIEKMEDLIDKHEYEEFIARLQEIDAPYPTKRELQKILDRYLRD